MSAFILNHAHIDVCVDAALATRYVTDPATGRPVADTVPSDLGWRMIRANVDSVIARYGPDGLSEDELDAAARLEPGEYHHRPNRAVAALWDARRLATYMKAVRSLDYQSCEVPEWDTTPIARLLNDILDDLTIQLRDVLAVPGSWAWDSADRGRLPVLDLPPRALVVDWKPPVEVVIVRDPDAADYVDVFLDGEPAANATIHTVDAGAGHTWGDWCEHRDTMLKAASPRARAVLLDALSNPPGGEYVEDRNGADWLAPAPTS